MVGSAPLHRQQNQGFDTPPGMAFTLDRVVPWGRSFEEYVRMFDLTETDLKAKILGCGDGPASFNSEMKEHGNNVVSIDPIYQFSTEQIQGRIKTTYERIMTQLLQNTDSFVWEIITSPEKLGRMRMAAMRKFLTDFEQGKQEGRYLTEKLPSLPFEDNEFDIALCSHFLFLYTEHLSLDFHYASISEMCRVAKEVRIFPLLDLGGVKSKYLDSIFSEFTEAGYTVEITQVDYEFQRGGNQMMKICR